MPADVDPELIVDAILMHVDDQNTLEAGSGVLWLQAEFTRVLAATMAGDVFVNSVSFNGESSGSMRQVSAKELLAILTQARRRLPDADGNQTSPATGAMLIPRLTGFIG